MVSGFFFVGSSLFCIFDPDDIALFTLNKIIATLEVALVNNAYKLYKDTTLTYNIQ